MTRPPSSLPDSFCAAQVALGLRHLHERGLVHSELTPKVAYYPTCNPNSLLTEVNSPRFLLIPRAHPQAVLVDSRGYIQLSAFSFCISRSLTLAPLTPPSLPTCLRVSRQATPARAQRDARDGRPHAPRRATDLPTPSRSYKGGLPPGHPCIPCELRLLQW